jgi:hypothetical protein
MKVLSESWSTWPQCQFANNKSKVFEEKEIRFIIYQMKRRMGKINLGKFCLPTSKRK